MNNIKMLYFDKIKVSDRIDVIKASASIEVNICHYWYVLNKDFKFQPKVCNRCHNLLMMSMNLSEIAILNNKGLDYCCIITRICKCEAIKLF